MTFFSNKIAALFLAIIFLAVQPAPYLFAEDSQNMDENAAPAQEEDSRAFFDPQAFLQNAGLAAAPTQEAVSSPVAQEAAANQNSKISLELKGVDVLDILKILATRSGLNIVAGKNVRGQVTIYLKDVQIRDALDTIISTLGLAYVEDRGILKVMTEQEYEALFGRSFGEAQITRTFKIKYSVPAAINQVLQQLKSPKGKVILDERTNTLIVTDRAIIVEDIANALKDLDEPLVTETFKLNYAQVADLETQFQEYLTPQNGVLKMDKRSNQISVTDRKEKIDQIRNLIKAIDVKPPQVLIEAQIVEVVLFDAFRYGIDWNYVRQNVGEFDSINIQPALDLSTPSASVGNGSLSTFTVDTDRGLAGLNTVISILQNVGKTNTLSSPRVTVLNNEEAKLIDATKQPYVSQTVVQGDTTSQTADNVQFVDIGVTLSVVPSISQEGNVTLKLKPEVSAQNGEVEVSGATTTGTGSFTRSSIPIVATQSLETTVIVHDGETLIVGGLIKDNEMKITRKIPVLGDLPFLGAIFRSEGVDFRKSELVIFLTPYIVSGEKTSEEHKKFFTAKGEFLDFDRVGGYDYALGQTFSQGPLRRDNKPYWRIEHTEIPRYWFPKDLYGRSKPFYDQWNEFEGTLEGKELPDPTALRKLYQAHLAQEVISVLQPLPELKDVQSHIDLAFQIRRDGVLKDVSFIDQGEIKNRKVRRLVLQTLKNASPYTQFPRGLDTQQELFDVRLTFKNDKNQESSTTAQPKE